MATMVCRNSPFMASPHIKLPPSFQFAFPDLDCDRHELNQILLNYTSVLPLPLPLPRPIPKKSDAESNSKSPTMATKEFELQQSVYVHPRSRSTLSDNSLAICTENLGNETGADFLQDSIFSDLKIDRSTTRKRVIKSIHPGNNNKVFPPPLTTIAGADSIRVRSYREDGRLIMKAVKTPARLSYFHVERSNGRLRLSILKSTPPLEFDSVEESTEKVRNDDVEDVGENGNYEEVMGRKVEENGNIGGAEIENEKFESPCRCNEAEENKNNTEMLLLTREPLISIWVSSTS